MANTLIPNLFLLQLLSQISSIAYSRAKLICFMMSALQPAHLEDEELADVDVHTAPPEDCLHDRRKVVVQDNDIRSLQRISWLGASREMLVLFECNVA
jgi:hypothetical protein